MSDDDDSYSFDDDFASASQDERFGLSSIYEEPDITSTETFSEPQSAPAAVDTAICEHDEQKYNERRDLHSRDHDSGRLVSQDRHVEEQDENYSLDEDLSVKNDDGIIGQVVEPECTSRRNEHTNATDEGKIDQPPKTHRSNSNNNAISAMDSADPTSKKDAETTAPTIEADKENQSSKSTEPQAEECKEDSKSIIFHRDPIKIIRRKTPAPLPRCATLTIKSMSRAHANSQTEDEANKSKYKYSKKRLEELAKPRKHHLYIKNDDAMRGQNDTKSSKTSIDTAGFVDRMVMLEEMRREKAAFAAAEAEYDARVDIDKLHCPNCGKVQSYSEVIARAMVCTSDRCKKQKVTYQKTMRKPKDFLERLERSKQRKSVKIEEIISERRSSLTTQCLEKSHRQKQLASKISSSFMSRMEKDINARHTKLSKHVALLDESLNKAHSFKPSIHIPEHLIRNRKGGLSSLAAPARRYTQTFEERLEECERKQGKCVVTKKRAPVESLWGR